MIGLLVFVVGFTAPPSLHTALASPSVSRSAAPACILPGMFGRTKKPASGGDLASIDHADPVELALTGGQRRALRATGKSLSPFQVADVGQAVQEVHNLLHDELIKCKFVSTDKKPEAQMQANELAVQVGAAVAECVGNECLLYRPPPAGTSPKYAI